ncbi:STAS domain-containing protein [Amycolatopsis magusensis]|uniref:Anti-sigma factor antagonist n=1 Tax=Amycolatopsis magusensis TaxID=882444 RepID=A0ABS4PZZ4_9PSEU|nr:STAS domain-containing protein [Amycolatopsis magusensis]MBP2184998.1 anti-anti-sigma factor [Amycolatopsis magusensis]MDI5979805.1 STAS domain-containing protein [Amycolatopsis magusensis]
MTSDLMASDGGSALTVRTERQGATVILVLTGEIDLLTAPRMREAGAEALREGPAALVLDLTDVSFLASAGLEALVELQEKTGGTAPLRVVAGNSATLRPLEITGLTEVLAVYPSLAEALAVG